MGAIETLQGATEALELTHSQLHGIGVVPAASPAEFGESAEINAEATGMFGLLGDSVSFRARFAVGTDLFRDLWIDVSCTYGVSSGYEFPKEVFLEFANLVALPALWIQAQSLLDPLLVAAGFPPGVLPSPRALGDDVFAGSRLPERIGSDSMEGLLADEQLTIPAPPEFDETSG